MGEERRPGEKRRKWSSSLPPQTPESFGFPGRDTPSSTPGEDVGWDQGENTGFNIQLGDRGPGTVLYSSVVSSRKWEQLAALCQPHLRTCPADSMLWTSCQGRGSPSTLGQWLGPPLGNQWGDFRGAVLKPVPQDLETRHRRLSLLHALALLRL